MLTQKHTCIHNGKCAHMHTCLHANACMYDQTLLYHLIPKCVSARKHIRVQEYAGICCRESRGGVCAYAKFDCTLEKDAEALFQVAKPKELGLGAPAQFQGNVACWSPCLHSFPLSLTFPALPLFHGCRNKPCPVSKPFGTTQGA